MSDDIITDPLRAAQLKQVEQGRVCRQFLDGIGGAAIQQMRETAIDLLTNVPAGRRHDDRRYRLAVALKVVTGLADTIRRCAVDGADAEAELAKWLELNGRSLFDVGR